MGYTKTDLYEEAVVRQKKYANVFRVPKEKLLYHYAGINTVWKILESDAFFARNIRFSNDSEEYKLGEELIEEYAENIFDATRKGVFDNVISRGIEMFYMTCFCENGDLLSQWRGYAKEGVSLGFDFLEEDGSQDSYAQIFTLVNNRSNCENYGKYKIDDAYTKVAEMPYQVFYVNKIGNESKQHDDGELLKNAMSSFEDGDTQTDLLLNLIPLIKDSGFGEEAEYRILFNLSNMGFTEAMNRKLRSKKIEYIDREGCKCPNIIVEVGDGELKERDVVEVILGYAIRDKAKNIGKSEDEIKQIYQEIMEKLAGFDSKINCKISDTKACVYVGEGKNQEDVMIHIEDVLQKNGISIEYENGVKIWCRGHLPIREVIIGPGEKKEKIKESLKHYMRNVYWLRYVKVRDSKIPLQS